MSQCADKRRRIIKRATIPEREMQPRYSKNCQVSSSTNPRGIPLAFSPNFKSRANCRVAARVAPVSKWKCSSAGARIKTNELSKQNGEYTTKTNASTSNAFFFFFAYKSTRRINRLSKKHHDIYTFIALFCIVEKQRVYKRYMYCIIQ